MSDSEPQPNPQEIGVEGLFENIKKAESQATDPSEPFGLGRLSPTNPEYKLLIASGVSEQEIDQGHLPRKTLLDAGLVFKNILGGGEKPIFKVEINGIDFGKLKFLTQDQLDQVRRYQQEHAERFFSEDADLEEIRHDMLSFLTAATSPSKSTFSIHPVNVFGTISAAMDRRRGPYERYAGTAKDWETAAKFMQSQSFTSIAQRVDWETKFIVDECADIYPYQKPSDNLLAQEQRGINLHVLNPRFQALRGTPSPFLDSGFHFGHNPDVTIYDGRLTSRLNMANVHLLSRGLNEIGEGVGSHDQHYITAAEYYRSVYPKAEAERETVQASEDILFRADQGFSREEMNKRLQERFLEKVKDWQTQLQRTKTLRSRLSSIKNRFR